jgi:hypothetical protein
LLSIQIWKKKIALIQTTLELHSIKHAHVD